MKNSWPTAIGICLMLTLAMILAEQGKAAEMGLMVIAGALGIAFLNLDRIKSFKGGGFEAEMRQAVDEAHATVAQLREMACSIAESTLTTLMAGNFGFSSGLTLDARLDLHDRLVTSLREINVTEMEIHRVRKQWSRGIGVIYHRGVHFALGQQKQRNQVNFDAPEASRKAADEFQKTLDFADWNALASLSMRTFIDVRGLMTPELADLLSDYAFFESTGELQRRQVFVTL